MKHTTQMTTKTLVAALLAAGMFSSVAHATDLNYVKVNDNGELNRSTEAATRYSVAVGIQTTAEGLSSVAIGSDTAANGEAAVALGALSDAQGIAATALGQGTQATANAATAVGRQAAASGNGSTAVGSVSTASASAATAFGSGSVASANNATALGQGAQASGSNAVAVGQKAAASEVATTAIGSGAVASGKYATATGTAATASGVASVASGLQSKAEGGSSVAIGRGAVAAENYSVALGSASKTEAAVGTTEATVKGVTYSGFAGTAPVATVSVGAADFERTITNVAAGRIEATSTDAINGSQLYLVANQVGTNVKNIATNAGNITVNATNIANNKAAIATNAGDIAANKADIATNKANIENNTTAINTNTTAINTNAGNIATNANNIAANTADIAENADNIANNAADIAGIKVVNAAQDEAIAAAKTEVIGGENVTIKNEPGANGQNVYTVSAKDTSASVSAGSSAVTVVPGATTKVGGVSVTDYAVDLSAATKESLAKADTAIQNIQAGSKVAVNKAGDTVTLSALTSEVKPGDNVKVKEETVDGRSVYTVSANSSTTAAGSDYVTVTPTTSTGDNGATNTTYTIDLAPTTKQAIDRNATAINGLNGRIDTLSNRIDDMEDDLRAGIAGATALAFLQRPNEAGKSMVSAAVSGFRDQQALAIGYARNSDNNKWSIKAGVGVNTQKDVNWGGSVGYQW